MTMADTVAVMNAGQIEQLGAPVDLYELPRTAFVANFLGQSNLLRARWPSRDGDDRCSTRRRRPGSRCRPTACRSADRRRCWSGSGRRRCSLVAPAGRPAGRTNALGRHGDRRRRFIGRQHRSTCRCRGAQELTRVRAEPRASRRRAPATGDAVRLPGAPGTPSPSTATRTTRRRPASSGRGLERRRSASRGRQRLSAGIARRRRRAAQRPRPQGRRGPSTGRGPPRPARRRTCCCCPGWPGWCCSSSCRSSAAGAPRCRPGCPAPRSASTRRPSARRTTPTRCASTRRSSAARSLRRSSPPCSCLLIGYPLAYAIALKAGRWQQPAAGRGHRAVLHQLHPAHASPGSRSSPTRAGRRARAQDAAPAAGRTPAHRDRRRPSSPA